MPATIEQLTHEALALPDTERAHLAQTLLRSLDTVTEEGVEEAWEAEVSRRLEQVHRGTALGRPADEVFRELRDRYRR